MIVLDVTEQLAAILWYRAGAVIPFNNAAPEVRARYRRKAERALAAADAES